MFTLQVSQASNQLRDSGLSDDTVDVLMNLLGNCSQSLVHRGQTTINTELPKAEYTIGDTGVPADGYPAASLTLISGGYQSGDKILGGFAGAVHGPMFFGGPVVFNQAVNGAVRFAKATANWSKGAGRPYVTCQECSDDTGSDAAGAAFNVYLPRTKPGDPNVIANAVLPFGLTRNGTRVCTGDYLDDKIGTVKAWALSSGSIPSGWGLFNGTGNSSGNGGSGLNPGTRLFKYHATPGTTGGSNSYTPAGTVSISSITGTVSVTVDSHTFTGTSTTASDSLTGTINIPFDIDLSGLLSDAITINDHPNHEHDLNPGYTLVDYDDASQTSVISYVLTPTAQGTDVGALTTDFLTHSGAYTGDIKAAFTNATAVSADADFDLTDWTHTHEVTKSDWNHGHTASGSFSFSSGSASFSGNAATIEPEWFGMIWIERLDNSV